MEKHNYINNNGCCYSKKCGYVNVNDKVKRKPFIGDNIYYDNNNNNTKNNNDNNNTVCDVNNTFFDCQGNVLFDLPLHKYNNIN